MLKLKRFMILLGSCLFSIIFFVIIFFLYQTDGQKQISPGNETAAETDAVRQSAERESIEHIEHSEKTEIEKTEIENVEVELIETEKGIVITESGSIIIDKAVKDNSPEGEDEEIKENEIDIGNAQLSENAFYYTALTENVKQRITGKSYPDTQEAIQITYDDLAYVHVLHYNFNAEIQEGELICNQAIAQDLIEIFGELYDNHYPIEKIRLVDEYDADDEASMADNNTSCFNYRTVSGKSKLSNHSYGQAIDINPLYNPYVRSKNGETHISPDNAAPYADRSIAFPYKIDKDDLCYKLFIQHGFSWGGAWNSSKDYQHFEKTH